MHEFTFLRHGRSLADDEKKCEGRYDSPLTEEGERQARKRAELFLAEDRTYDSIRCSTLSRARRTAEIFGEVLGLTVIPDPVWMEANNGGLAGLTFAEARERFPIPDFYGPFDHMAETGESSYELRARAETALQSIVDLPDGRYLIVSHGGILNETLRAICSIPVTVNFSGVSFSFGDTSHIDVSYQKSRHKWSIREFRR